MNIVIIAGSPRAQSLTVRIALLLKRTLSERTNHYVSIINAQDWQALPFVERKYASLEQVPDSEIPIATKMLAADAFILVSPEYNGSYSPALKNIVDRFTCYHHKPIGIATGSPGKFGGMRAAMQLQNLVYGLGGIGLPLYLAIPEVENKISAEGELLDMQYQGVLDTFMAEYLWLADKLKGE